MNEANDAFQRMLCACDRQGALTHCITNQVAAPLTANALLACGASPVMVIDDEECADIAGVADGLLVNVGTFTVAQGMAMHAAITGMRARGRPWVLDPVAVGQLSRRTQWLQAVLPLMPPAIVRGNASEVIALSGGQPGRGTDSTVSPRMALASARHLLAQGVEVVAISGKQDLIVSAQGVTVLAHGHSWLTQLSGAGCMLGGVMAACAGLVNITPREAAIAATLWVTLSAERAAATTPGVGSFAVQLLDEMARWEADDVADMAINAWAEAL